MQSQLTGKWVESVICDYYHEIPLMVAALFPFTHRPRCNNSVQHNNKLNCSGDFREKRWSPNLNKEVEDRPLHVGIRDEPPHCDSGDSYRIDQQQHTQRSPRGRPRKVSWSTNQSILYHRIGKVGKAVLGWSRIGPSDHVMIYLPGPWKQEQIFEYWRVKVCSNYSHIEKGWEISAAPVLIRILDITAVTVWIE